MIYQVKAGDTLSKIAQKHQCTIQVLLHVNPKYRADPDRLFVGSKLVIPNEGIAQPKLVREVLPNVLNTKPIEDENFLKVKFGQLTFDAEGNDKANSLYYSRVLHVPSNSSGATIGRGYDMKERTEEEVLEDLTTAKVGNQVARKLANCSGFSGKRAKEYIENNNLKEIEINREQQHILFSITVDELWGDCIRLMTKADVLATYGKTDIEGLPQWVKDLVLDLRYRGDYTPATRRIIQPLLVAADFQGLMNILQQEDLWRGRFGVPKDRFERRAKYAARNV